jgi:hypothetical protein
MVQRLVPAEFIPRKLWRKERARALGRARHAVDGIGDQETVAGAGRPHRLML